MFVFLGSLWKNRFYPYIQKYQHFEKRGFLRSLLKIVYWNISQNSTYRRKLRFWNHFEIIFESITIREKRTYLYIVHFLIVSLWQIFLLVCSKISTNSRKRMFLSITFKNRLSPIYTKIQHINENDVFWNHFEKNCHLPIVSVNINISGKSTLLRSFWKNRFCP